ncbi:MAG: cysteine desulfurase family protein [Candidatus Altiarchaeota archaeon]
MKVYFDHAATAPTDQKVVDAMLPYFTKQFGNASSLHEFGREAKEALESSRQTIAEKINAEPDEIVFTSGGSESDNLALKGTAFALRPKGSHILTSKIEHPAVLSTCKQLEKEGFSVTYLSVDSEGFINLKELESSITDKTTLVSIMHANNEVGVIQDLEAIGKVCARKGVCFHSDCVQSFTKVPIDVRRMNLNLASFSAHKIHGPKGVGALYVKKGTKLYKQMEGGHHEHNLRAGTENIPGIVGFAKAVELAKEEHIKHMVSLRDRLISEFLKISDTRLNGPRERRLCNNVNIAFKYVEGESLLLRLDMKGVAVSTGSACSSQSLKPSHVLIAIGMKPEDAHGTLRFTLGRENTLKEVEYTIDAVREAVEQLRAMSPLVKRKG